MFSSYRLSASLRLLPALLVFLSATGCSVANSPLAANSNYDRDEQMFVAGYEDIDEVYIQKPDMGNLTMGGLSALASIDDKISVARSPDKVELLYNGKSDADYVTNDRFAADDWAVLTTGVVEEARKISPAVAKADSEAIYQAVFNGVDARLDPFTRYAGQVQAEEHRALREGFGGIGVVISLEDTALRVVSVEHYTPAERAGMHVDDVITAIDGTPTKSMDQQTAVEKLRGPVDSRVVLTVARTGVQAPLTVAITRALVIPETVSYRREGDIAYFRIYSFNLDTADSLRRAFQDARNEIGSHMRGIVLDLRGNPGGLLDQAVAMCDLFLDHGRVVSTKGRHPDSDQYYEATPGDISEGLPIAVLVNGGSASASEIVAAALQDNGRAVVIGSNSYGKGTVQTVFTMPNKGELTVTWARFHAPSGYTLNHLGVLPNICTDDETLDATQIMADLGAGKIPPLPVAERDSVSPDDTPALDKLRALCPVYKAERAIDLQVALRLLTQPNLYGRAVALAAPKGNQPGDQSALNQTSAQP
jgi:carboxyl-terminal processing protease